MNLSRRSLLVLGAVLLVAVLVAGGALVDLYAELAWFRSLGYEARFWKLELVGWGTGVGLFALAAVGVGFTLRRVTRGSGPVQVRRRLGDLEIAEAVPGGWVRAGLVAASALAGLLVAAPFAEPLSRSLLFFLHSEPWGGADPILGSDPRFYVFTVPLLRLAWSVAVAGVTWAIVGVVAVLLLAGRVRATGEGVTVDPFARRWLSYAGAAVLLLVALHFGLSVYEAVAGGPVGYAEVRGEIPARRLVAILAIVAAAAVVYSGLRNRWRPALTAGAVLAGAWLLGLGGYPQLLQRLVVEPNELEVERPYIEMQIEATRRGFGLDDLGRVPFEVRREPPSRDTLDRWTESLPLWDERPLRATYNQLQGLIAFHEFPDVDMDRYGEPGAREQIAVAVREFAPGRLDPSARTWLNLHFRYTHGTGAVVTAVDRSTEGGEPAYYVQDLPPATAPDAPAGLEVEEPKVYFGELTTQYAIVARDSVPEGLDPAGVPLAGLLRRGAFAWALGSKNILLRTPSEGGGFLLWRREVVERVRALVPFLLVDPNVYPVLHEGRVKWIVELYASSASFPLSERAEIGGRGTNYVRGAAKAVVDGITGEVRLYLTRPEEPLASTFRRTFPGLFRPLSEMPAGLRAHLRYPRPLFRTQARVLEAYHMTEPGEFYQRQDLWSLGREVYAESPTTVEPYYLLMPFPGADGGRREFLLTTSYTPRNRDNLSAFLIARSDGEHYGELWLFDVVGQRQVFGPRQVEVQIDQDPVISQQLTLWRQRGSRAIRGHLLLVPVEGFLLYVEPLFLEAEDREGAAPGLKRVITAAGDRVAMGMDLAESVDRLLGKKPRATPTVVEGGPAEGMETGEPAETAGGAAVDEELRSLLREAERALRAGDLARFGELWERIRRAAGVEEAAPPRGGESPE